MRSGAKKAVVWTCSLGILATVGATAMSWDALTERYWLWKLETGDAETALAAAEELSRRHSVRAVRPLVERIRAASTEVAYGWSDRPGRRRRVPGEIDPSCTDAYLPPLTLCLHGIGPTATTALHREIETMEAEIEVLHAEVDRVLEQAVLRTYEALLWVRRAWRDEGLSVHAEMPAQRRIIS